MPAVTRRPRLIEIALVAALAFATVVIALAAPLIDWSRLPGRASARPGYVTIYLPPAQIRGIDIGFRPLPLPAPKDEADWQRLEADTALPRLLRNGAAAGLVGGVAGLPLVLILALRRVFRRKA